MPTVIMGAINKLLNWLRISNVAFVRTIVLLAVAFSLSPSALAAEDPFDPAATYQKTCFACHGTGAAHAPEVGDVIEWEIRSEKGLDTLVNNTINGLNGIMPVRGLCTDCSDDDLKAIVEYMLEESL